MLEDVILGNTIKSWGISLLIIVVTVILMKLFSLLNKKLLKPFSRKTANSFDNIIVDSLEPPILFGMMLLGIWIAIHRLESPAKFIKIIDESYKILVTLNVTWLFARIIDNIIETYWIRKVKGSSVKHDNRMMPVVKRTIIVLVWVMGVITALSNAGVNISALLGTLGIGGIAFALAAQDTVKNIFGAFTIFADRPFTIGDTVRIDSFEGTIIDVGVRSTKMLDYDKRIVTFPNYKIADASIINISAEPMRRVVMKIALTYDTSSDDMEQALGMLRALPGQVEFLSSEGLTANFSDIAETALYITFIYFIEKEGDIAKVTSDVNLAIYRQFKDAGLKFAYPTQTYYIENKEEAAS